MLFACGYASVTEEQVQSLISTVNSDNSGQLNFHEFLSLMVLIMTVETDTQVIAASSADVGASAPLPMSIDISTFSEAEMASFKVAFDSVGEPQ